MTFWLSSKNVLEYLIAKGLSSRSEEALVKIEAKNAKNFNLLLRFPDSRQILVKQQPYRQNQKTSGAFVREWRIQSFLQQFPELSYLRSWLPEVLCFDPDNAIMVVNYLGDYEDLSDFYDREKIFSTSIPTAIGTILGKIHCQTLKNREYQEFFGFNSKSKVAGAVCSHRILGSVHRWARINPEVFAQVSQDGLKFYALYQRYDSLQDAIAELAANYEPCCLTHNDLKLNNILLAIDWQQKTAHSILPFRLIDWEFSDWGDPAFDLGSLIASYLKMWLDSLVVSQSIPIEDALILAETPLELLQPSLTDLASAYRHNFPQILELRPDFWQRVLQFSGLSLIQAIRSTLRYQKFFGNTGICMLQVAKTLLCHPEESLPMVFGNNQLLTINKNQDFSSIPSR